MELTEFDSQYYQSLEGREKTVSPGENAIYHTQKGGEIRVSVNSVGSHIHLVIKDTGSGIPENRLNSLFKSYYQVK